MAVTSTGEDRPDADPCVDAVVIIPGIMGSELRDTATGDVLWGTRDLSWYASAWTTGSGLADLRLSDEERQGRYGRVCASGLLRFPAFARVLAGVEPYTKLVRTVRGVAVHPDAVREFPYDWRLPVRHNAGLLAEAIDRHWTDWTSHAAYRSHLRDHPGCRDARVVLVAHSMGGLLARCLALIPGATQHVGTTITLGTPFYGSVKATVLLNSGRGAPLPLPRHRPLSRLLSKDADDGLRRLGQSLPGLHDLLPSYRCVDEGTLARRLTASDVESLGGDRELAQASFELHERMLGVPLVGHRAVVGVAQPTMQSLVLDQGEVTPRWTECQVDDLGRVLARPDRGGDGTVYRDAAGVPAVRPSYLPQQHGALARSVEAIQEVASILTEREEHLGPYLGDGELGIDTADLVPVGEDWSLTITGTDQPASVTCYLEHLPTGHLSKARVEGRGDQVRAVCRVDEPGLYRVVVSGSGMSPVTQLVLASGL